MASTSIEQLHLFHKMDRDIFSCLVLQLSRNPSESLLVMALWLWLEHIGYPSLILKLIGHSPNTINCVAQEAVSCLDCLESQNYFVPNNGGLLQTTAIMGREISLQLFKLKRYTMIAGIKSVLRETCARIFDDILLGLFGKTCVSKLLPPYPYYRVMIIPELPHKVFGEFPPTNSEELNRDRRIWKNKQLFDDVVDEDKTLFLTFSRGFPVTREDIIYLFTIRYGVYCIKALRMGRRSYKGQVLDATMVVNNLETVDRILNGIRIAKFNVNGRHIWARKYDRRE